jgi:glycosyltransferase involved in cell wall biosynthesis
MTEKVCALLDDRAVADEMGRTGRALLESHYSWRVLAHDILRVLEKE